MQAHQRSGRSNYDVHPYEEISNMPSMKNYAYFASLVASGADVWACQGSTTDKIAAFVDECANVGLIRGLHYSVAPLSKADIYDVIEAKGFQYPSMVPLIEIKFRSAKHFNAAVSSGIVQNAEGSEEERPIWG